MSKVLAVSKSQNHTFSKHVQPFINLLAGYGVEGDAHMGKTVKHRSRVKQDPNQPNLRQVHLIHTELFDELKEKGYKVEPGELGENITTVGIDLLSLPKDTILHIGDSAKIQITGLRNPCKQLDLKQKGLMQAVLDKNENGELVRKAGIMAIVIKSGLVFSEDKIKIEMPPKPYVQLERV